MYLGAFVNRIQFLFLSASVGWVRIMISFARFSGLVLSAWGKRGGDVGYILSHDSLASSSCLQHASWARCDRVIEWKVGVASEVCLFMAELAGLLCDSIH
jgi:hypothetical protein